MANRAQSRPGPRLSARLVRRICTTACCWLSMAMAHASDDGIAQARYAEPVERYGHFALGRPHEYARLQATTESGRELAFELPEDEVFEDLVPRIVRLAAGEPAEILAIVSKRAAGSRLMLLRSNGARLETSAQSAPIGAPNRWLNPVAVVDLDGDGRAEIAAVVTPHIGGSLTVYRRQGDALVQIAARSGYSNHVYGTTALALSVPMSIGGHLRLVVPDANRRRLEVVGLEQGRLVVQGRCALPAPVTGDIRVLTPTTLSVGLPEGRQLVVPGDCPA